MKKLILSISAVFLAGSAWAQSDISLSRQDGAYAQDSRTTAVRSSSGLCWHTGSWTTQAAVAGCDGPLTPPVNSPEKPAVVIPAPVTAPVVAASASAPKRCDFSITLQNDESFDFNQYALKTAAKQRIDKDLIGKIAQCAKLDIIIVTGHTDLIGNQQYNQKLSEKRADAVASYLTSRGVKAMIDTMGMGKTQQIKACDEHLPTKQLQACLAPNRRVVIEVKGLQK
ncbi:OmpA family protein [Undibacterium oligocarboniphilum]|uniref:OmpA family protein n=1 Tax=Undibacterium oligocarboniphilum TaxID=666702 RepID=A0A850QKS8_9BURK|nr:OmpA family protein [Undibacterium oligocarboniphilum]MBC3869727.1 OmpA family protein [Undibacterium oligocarboniphilum]NVO77330.1 OmpA family protein [Undibacterium oligocarboniphilum]